VDKHPLKGEEMSKTTPPQDSLVLYKTRPARVQQIGEKLILELEDGGTVKVRPKDVVLLHGGPLRDLGDLRRPPGDVQTAWELLAGQDTTLSELAELAFGSYTPATAWGAWELIAEGLYFRGTPEEVRACSADEVEATLQARAADRAEREAWDAFLARVEQGGCEPADARYLREVESLALGQTRRSRVLHALGREETPENAHAFLLDLGYWSVAINPYPKRLGAVVTLPESPPGWARSLADLPAEERLDLTRLPAFAIDDEHTENPDDALTYIPGTDGNRSATRLWVHVADPAALVRPGDPIDLEARGRGATLHLPEGLVPMLPAAATPLFGLGLADVSPALSFAIDLSPEGEPVGLEIAPSWVRVTRLTYEQAEARLSEEPFRSLLEIARGYAARRRANGAIEIDLPETSVRVEDDRVTIRPGAPLQSRVVVQNAMIMAGEAVARFGREHGIPLPHATQDPPDALEPGEGLAGMFALRKSMQRSQFRVAAAPHSGLGLPAYVQVTSPLRRYLDLVVHQQLRAYLGRNAAPSGELEFFSQGMLAAGDIQERIGAVESVIGSVRQAENLSNRHWTLVYLLQHPRWHGGAVLVEMRGANGIFIIPDLALETRVRLARALPIGSEVILKLRSVDLPRLEARFGVEAG
jgi:exoribonuclease-2